ncbi:hypothetical protein [Azospirillum sp. sgz301742]
MFKDPMSDDSIGLRPAARSGSLAWLAPVSLMLLIAAAVPVLLPEVPPLTDYPNHLMRLHAIAYLDLDPDLSRFYRIQWGILPNLLMDVLVPPLGTLIGMDAAFKAFVVAMFVALVSGSFALYRAVWGRLELGPLAAFLFLYTVATYMGLFNYLFGLGMALWALAAWVAVSGRGPLTRAAVSLAAVPLLFFAHLFALGIYGLGLLAYESWRLTATGTWTEPQRLIPDLAAFGLPLLIGPALLLQSPAADFAGAFLWVGSAKLMGFDWLFGAYAMPIGVVTGAAVALGLAWGLWSGALRLHPAGWIVIGLGLASFAALPLVLFGSYFADSRLPVGILFLAIGFARWELPSAAARSAFVAVIATLALLRCVDAGTAFARIEPDLKDMRQALTLIRPGSTVLVAIADGVERRSLFRHTQYTDDRVVSLGLHHMPVLAMARGSYVSTAYVHPGKQVLQIRDEYADLDSSIIASLPRTTDLLAATLEPWTQADRYWGRWTTRFDTVVVLYTAPFMDNPVPGHLVLAHEGRMFRIYQVKP